MKVQTYVKSVFPARVKMRARAVLAREVADTCSSGGHGRMEAPRGRLSKREPKAPG